MRRYLYLRVVPYSSGSETCWKEYSSSGDFQNQTHLTFRDTGIWYTCIIIHMCAQEYMHTCILCHKKNILKQPLRVREIHDDCRY